MSEDLDTHSPAAEEEEEGPNRMRIILFAILGYSIVACASYFFFFQLSADSLLDDTQDSPSSGNAAEVVSSFPTAAYLAPEGDQLLTSQQIAAANLQVVSDAVTLATLLGNNPDIRTIYIHPVMLNEVDTAVFRQQYEARKLLVAINTPLSELATVIEITPSVPDLPLEEFVSGTAVAAIQARENGPPLEFVATYAQFDQIPGVIIGLR